MSPIRVGAAWVFAFCASALHAQQPGPTLAQLDHKAWTIRDGAPPNVVALAQSADGVLWIGTQSGLYRFDGVRFEEFEPPAGQSLPSPFITALLAVPDGSMWIGYVRSGASIIGADSLVKFGQNEGLPAGSITAFARDSGGAIWAATTTGLARLDGTRWRTLGAESGYPGGMTTDLLVDRRGTLWAATSAGVFVLPSGAQRFVWWAPSLDVNASGGGAPREAPDGSVWGASLAVGLTRLSDSAGHPVGPERQPPRSSAALALVIDRNATAWMLLQDSLLRMPLGGKPAGSPGTSSLRDVRSLSASTGMSGGTPSPNALLEDREGNVWLGTEGGLDRFRATKLTPVLLPRALRAPDIVASDGGRVWVDDYSGPLLEVGPGIVAHPEVAGPVSCASRDFDGSVWIGGPAGLWHVPRGKLASGATITRIPLPADAKNGDIQAIARGRDGILWLSVRSDRARAVFRRLGATWDRFLPSQHFAREHALSVVADDAGTTWLGYSDNNLVRVRADSMRLFSGNDGIRVGTVTAILPRDDHLWVGGESGVMRYNGARFVPLAVASGPLRGVTGIVETAEGDLWFNAVGGVRHVRAAQVQRAMRDPRYIANDERFDFHDGLPGEPPQLRPLPSAIQGTDGRLWFLTTSGVAWLDPAHIRRNPIPPPVEIRALTAGGRRYRSLGRVDLPPRTTALQIGYTALSLGVPDRVQFRYRLIGSDTTWVEAGTRRDAFYTNLRPGSYRFQVIAANEDGVWNEVGAAFEFAIPPTFTQSRWFLAVWMAALGGLVWLVYLARVRQVAAGLRARYQAALVERTRIAQELHDTLLQGFTGITLQLRAIQRVLAQRPQEGAEALKNVLASADTALRDARHMIWDMRAVELEDRDLADALEHAARATTGNSTELVFTVSGDRRALPLAVETTAFRIGREAVLNAVKHAAPRRVTVDLEYELRFLTLRVSDDGTGIAPDAMDAAEKGRHWGIAGMRERAQRTGGTLEISSEPGRGTVVSVALPIGEKMAASTGSNS